MTSNYPFISSVEEASLLGSQTGSSSMAGSSSQTGSSRASEAGSRCNGHAGGARRSQTVAPWQVAFVTEDLSRRREEAPRDLHRTAFYRIVLGGNVAFARAVLEQLNAGEDKRDLEWLIQPRLKKLRTDFYQQSCGVRKVCMFFARLLLFLGLGLVFFLATIIFYSMHHFLYGQRMRKRKRISADIELPIAFAALSGKKEMIQLFKDYGVDLDQRDPNLNNVFHYISDMSVEQPERALVAYHSMLGVVPPDRDLLRELIYTKGHNAYGVTPFEHMALIGSPVLIAELSRTVGVIREPVLSISEKDVLMQTETGEGNFTTSPTPRGLVPDERHIEFGCTQEPRYNLDKFNVSIYENSDVFGKQSRVLNIMATRELTLLSQREIRQLYKCPFLNRWWHFKVSQMATFTSLLQALDILYTVLILLLLVSVGGDTRITPLANTHIRVTTQTFLTHLDPLGPVLYDNANSSLALEARRLLPQLAERYKTLPRRRELDDYANDPGMRIDELTPYFREGAGFEDLNRSMVEEMYKAVCNNSGAIGEGFDACQEEAVGTLMTDCHQLDRDTILNSINLTFGGYYEILTFRLPIPIYGKAINILLIIIVSIAGLYLVFDLIERWIFLFRKVAHLDRPIRGILLATISTSFPGSYTKRQLNVLSCSCFVGFLVYVLYKQYYDPDATLAETEHRTNMNSYFIISGLVFRFLMHIHAMRLLRGIGHFVITTYMMGTNLLHFTTVYAAVLFVFSVIFHFLMRQPHCPALKLDPYDNLMRSMFTTFQLGLGHGEVDIFSLSTPVQVTYILYTIICVLLLMNLIIAIMSTTATQIMTDPWKTATWEMEWLKEALSAETTFQIITSPLQRCIGLPFLKSVGFSIGRKMDKGNVYIEVFSCTEDDK